jgi:hypothetical protein
MNEISEGLAAAQLHLARLLLREVVGAEGPTVGPVKKLQPKTAAEVAGKGGRKREDKATKRKQQQKKQEEGKKAAGDTSAQTGAAGAASTEQGDGSGSSSIATPGVSARDGDKEEVGSPKAAAPPASAPGKSWAAIAATAPEPKPATATTVQPSSATAPGGQTGPSAAGGGISLPAAAPPRALLIPTAVLDGLATQLRSLPEDSAERGKVSEAIRTLGDARQTFINCGQQAGAVEALAWLMAAKGAVHAAKTGGRAQHLIMKGTGSSTEAAAAGGVGAGDGEGGGAQKDGGDGDLDMSEVLSQVKGTVELLQALVKELGVNIRGSGAGEGSFWQRQRAVR